MGATSRRSSCMEGAPSVDATTDGLNTSSQHSATSASKQQPRGRGRRVSGMVDPRLSNNPFQKQPSRSVRNLNNQEASAPSFRRQRSKSTNQTPKQRDATLQRARRSFGTKPGAGKRMPPRNPSKGLQARRETRQSERAQQEACERVQAAVFEHALLRNSGHSAASDNSRNIRNSGALDQALSKTSNIKSKSRRHTFHNRNPVSLLAADDDSENSENSFFEDNSSSSNPDDLTIATFVTCAPKEEEKEQEKPTRMRRSSSHQAFPKTAPKTTTTSTKTSSMRRSTSQKPSGLSHIPRRSSKNQLLNPKEPPRKNRSFDESETTSRIKSSPSHTSPMLQARAARRSSSLVANKKERPTMDTKGPDIQSSRTSLALLKLGKDVSLDTSQHTETTAASSMCDTTTKDASLLSTGRSSDKEPSVHEGDDHTRASALKMKHLSQAFRKSTGGIQDVDAARVVSRNIPGC